MRTIVLREEGQNQFVSPTLVFWYDLEIVTSIIFNVLAILIGHNCFNNFFGFEVMNAYLSLMRTFLGREIFIRFCSLFYVNI